MVQYDSAMPLEPHRFLASKRLYAIDKTSFRKEESRSVFQDGRPDIIGWKYHIEAVWFKKRSNGRTAAFFGSLWDYSLEEYDVEDLITQISTSRYGGDPYGLWDGVGTWWGTKFSNSHEEQTLKLPFLQEMLENYPQIPQGYDGWYAFN